MLEQICDGAAAGSGHSFAELRQFNLIKLEHLSVLVDLEAYPRSCHRNLRTLVTRDRVPMHFRVLKTTLMKIMLLSLGDSCGPICIMMAITQRVTSQRSSTLQEEATLQPTL